MANKTKLNQIGQIAVNVRDLEVAVAFYRDILGMDFLFQVPDSVDKMPDHNGWMALICERPTA